MPRLSQQQRDQALGRLHAGETARRVANHFNVNVRTIYRLQQRVQATGTSSDRPRSGRPPVTTLRQNRQIVRHHLQNRFARATQTARTTIGTHQRPISDDTVRRRLRDRNLSCRRPYRGPILTARHRRARLQWATHRRNWRHRHWRTVVFSDESRYCISTADGRVRVWRRRGERFNDECVLERDSWGGPSIMVWGAIALNHKLGPMVFENVGAGR